MKDDSDGMDKSIKDKFEGHEVRVSTNLWKSIESKLPPEKGNKHYRLFFKNPFTLIIILISSVIIASSIMYSKKYYTDKNMSKISTILSARNEDQNSPHTPTINTNISDTLRIRDEYGFYRNPSTYATYNETKGKNTLPKNISTQQNRSLTKSNTDLHSICDQNLKSSVTTIHSTHSSNQETKKKNTHSNVSDDLDVLQRKKTNLSTHVISDKNIYSKELKSRDFSTTKSTKSINDNLSESNASSQLNKNRSVETSISSTTNSTKKTYQKKNTESQLDSLHSISTNMIFDSSMQQSTLANADLITIHSIVEKTQRTDLSTKNELNKNNLLNLQHENLSDSINIHLVLTNKDSIAAHASNINRNQNNQELETDSSIYQFSNSREMNAANETHFLNSTTQHSLTKKISERSIDTLIVIHNVHASAQTADTSTTVSSEKSDSTIENNSSDTSTIKNTTEIIATTSVEEKKKKPVFLSKCSFDGYITPALNYMNILPANKSELKDSFAVNKKTGSAITIGLRMNYALTKKLEVGIGVQYSSMSQRSTLTQKNTSSNYYTYQGFNKVDSSYDSLSNKMIYSNHFMKTDSTLNTVYSTHSQKYLNKYQCISIPIHIAYGYSITDRLSLLARTSLTINYQTHSVTYLNESEEQILIYHSQKNISLGGSFSIGCYYAFSRKCSVFTEPIINYYFSNVFDKHVPFKQTPLLLGIQTGVRMSF